MTEATSSGGKGDADRRDFLIVAASAFGAVGTAAALWPFVDSFNPTADVLALSGTEVDLSAVAEGQAITVVWRGKPIFVRHRTADEITRARADDQASLPDPQTDADRAIKPEWLVMIGICTHLGCVPLGRQGEFGGWFCPCHGSHYDTSGRIRKGPAPSNLHIPPYRFVADNRIYIG
jgi:ubiquinol-cytochrome c reductase iron-sulfur subunit